MYISRDLNSRSASVTASVLGVTSTATATHPEDLHQLQELIERATATGRLDRQDEDAILAALARKPRYSVEKCELFRELQERVWQAELHLEW